MYHDLVAVKHNITSLDMTPSDIIQMSACFKALRCGKLCADNACHNILFCYIFYILQLITILYECSVYAAGRLMESTHLIENVYGLKTEEVPNTLLQESHLNDKKHLIWGIWANHIHYCFNQLLQALLGIQWCLTICCCYRKHPNPIQEVLSYLICLVRSVGKPAQDSKQH